LVKLLSVAGVRVGTSTSGEFIGAVDAVGAIVEVEVGVNVVAGVAFGSGVTLGVGVILGVGVTFGAGVIFGIGVETVGGVTVFAGDPIPIARPAAHIPKMAMTLGLTLLNFIVFVTPLY
jgi:hypothetical protein